VTAYSAVGQILPSAQSAECIRVCLPHIFIQSVVLVLLQYLFLQWSLYHQPVLLLPSRAFSRGCLCNWHSRHLSLALLGQPSTLYSCDLAPQQPHQLHLHFRHH